MRNWVNSPSISTLGFGVFKAIVIRSSELMARFTRTRAESWRIVVFENGEVREVSSAA